MGISERFSKVVDSRIGDGFRFFMRKTSKGRLFNATIPMLLSHGVRLA